MARNLNKFVTLTLIALCFACSSGLSWGALFGGSTDEGEASAVEIERGRTEKAISEPTKSKSFNGKTASSVEHIIAEEVPLPDEHSAEAGTSKNSDEKTSKQFLEPVLAATAEGAPSKPRYEHDTEATVVVGTDEHTNTREESREERKKHVETAEEKYSTIKKEIEDMAKQLGPEIPAQESEPGTVLIQRKEGSAEEHRQGYGNGQGHSALTKGIEQAIAGLTSVYNTLRANDAPETSLGHGGGPGTAEAGRRQGKLDEENGEHGGAMLSARTAGGNWTRDSGAELMESETVAGRNGTGAQGADVGEVEGKQGGGISGLTIVAGVAFVGAVGLLVMGYSQMQERVSSGTGGPLYPPRGPSYV